jgi:hypothetical protein
VHRLVPRSVDIDYSVEIETQGRSTSTKSSAQYLPTQPSFIARDQPCQPCNLLERLRHNDETLRNSILN